MKKMSLAFEYADATEYCKSKTFEAEVINVDVDLHLTP